MAEDKEENTDKYEINLEIDGTLDDVLRISIPEPVSKPKEENR